MAQVTDIRYKGVAQKINELYLDSLTQLKNEQGNRAALNKLKMLIDEEYLNVTGDLCHPDDFWKIYNLCKVHYL